MIRRPARLTNEETRLEGLGRLRCGTPRILRVRRRDVGGETTSDDNECSIRFNPPPVPPTPGLQAILAKNELPETKQPHQENQGWDVLIEISHQPGMDRAFQLVNTVLIRSIIAL